MHFRPTTYRVSQPLCILQGRGTEPLQNHSYVAMASTILSQAVVRVLGLDWVLPAIRPPLCPNRGTTHPTSPEGKICMVSRCSDCFWQLKAGHDRHSDASLARLQCPLRCWDRFLGFRHGIRVDAKGPSNRLFQQAVLPQATSILNIHPQTAHHYHRCEMLATISPGPRVRHTHWP